MPIKLKEAQPPRGVMRLLFRLPIWLYRGHLGWIVGQRFLLLTHIGRKSGQKRQSVLEVFGYEQSSNIYYVFVGFGQRSDWLRNVEKTPQVTLKVGRRCLSAVASRASAEVAEERILIYARRYPIARKVLPRMIGYQLDGSEEDFREFARIGIVMAFQVTGNCQ